jgi:signal transduction histidine kinase
MTRLVDRMLTLARADAGFKLGLAPVDLRALVEEVSRQAAGVHQERRFTVHAVDVMVDGDEDALRQLLWILLDNAVRYAKAEVIVDLAAESGWARLIVADDGPGIAPAERERVFERFYRSDPARAGGHAGLGLAIAGWIVEQHGGRIIAGDSLTGGAALLVDLPQRASHVHPAPASPC